MLWSMAWTWLFLAGLLEIAWAIGLKFSQGFTRPLASLLTILGMLASFWFLSLALKTLPIGTGYAVWTGIGAVGTTILGVILFAEPVTAVRIISIGLIIVGILGLKAGG
jgi:quaternary ammonium compound-resistance protein SugE